MKHGLAILALFVLATSLEPAGAQAPVADLEYRPNIPNPAYAGESGPVVRIDEAHRNYHTVDGRYGAFANLLRRDGFRVEASKSELSLQALDGTNILVVANAEADQVPARAADTVASAFTDSEITALHRWVEQGGSLLIIADHPPFSDSATALAKGFGFELIGGVALNPPVAGRYNPLVVFESGKGLMPTVLSRGRSTTEQVDSVMTFTGSAFKVPKAATAVLVFQDGARSFPARENGPDFAAPGTPIAGQSQGALLELGKGRIAVFGEAAMFTAQRVGPRQEPMGMNTPDAKQNYQFVLNLMHWLSRTKDMRE